MKKMPLISVVVPVYNMERHLRRCIDSVLAQTFQNFEIICVNDGSTDNSLELLSSYSDSRVFVVNQMNQGLAAARNTGINRSRGLFIALLDSDDFWMPGKLAAHFRHLQTRPTIDISYSASAFVDDDDKPLGIGQYPKLKGITPQHIFCRNPVGNGSAAVMRRSFLMKIARPKQGEDAIYFEYFDEELRQSEDIEFWLRSALDVKAKFEGIPEALTCYRVNASGLSANLSKQFNYWQRGIDKNREKHSEFFLSNYKLAAAYQKRYLARRAVQSGNGTVALKFLTSAIFDNWRILVQEPKRTLMTYAAAACSFLPHRIYQHIEHFAMQYFGKKA